MPHVLKTLDQLTWAFGGRVALVRSDLQLSAFGAQLFDFRPGDGGPPEHDESGSGQEELYFGLTGSGWIDIDGDRIPFGAETLVSVPPGTRRKIHVGPNGLRYLCVGGVPGGAYSPPSKFA